jgi:hypothetical protein
MRGIYAEGHNLEFAITQGELAMEYAVSPVRDLEFVNNLGWLCLLAGQEEKAESYFSRVAAPQAGFIGNLATYNLGILALRAC